MEKATFDDLLRRKLQRENDKKQITTLDIPSLGRSLVFERIPDTDIVELMDSLSEDTAASSAYDMYRRLIYRCCPLLHDKSVREGLGAANPLDGVTALLDVGEVMGIGARLAAFCGIDSARDDIKNA